MVSPSWLGKGVVWTSLDIAALSLSRDATILNTLVYVEKEARRQNIKSLCSMSGIDYRVKGVSTRLLYIVEDRAFALNWSSYRGISSFGSLIKPTTFPKITIQSFKIFDLRSKLSPTFTYPSSCIVGLPWPHLSLTISHCGILLILH